MCIRDRCGSSRRLIASFYRVGGRRWVPPRHAIQVDGITPSRRKPRSRDTRRRGRPGACGRWPVSYTHLDVYKRQVSVFYAFNTISIQVDFVSMEEALSQLLGGIFSGLTLFLAAVMGFLMVYANGFIMKRRKKEFGLYQAVSYTHLDVYKRQVPTRVPRRVRSGARQSARMPAVWARRVPIGCLLYTSSSARLWSWALGARTFSICRVCTRSDRSRLRCSPRSNPFPPRC